jgi:DHA2 family multidrug resistance protein
MIAVFIYILDSTIANVALPHMAGTFSVTRDESMWILTSYLISSSIMVPMVDWFSKFFGRKNFFILSILIFTFSSMLCGMATSIEFMIFARILQGAGGGGILPITQAVMMETFQGEERPKAMAVFGMAVILAPIIGPVLGGWITDNWTWQWVFYINIFPGCLAALLCQKLLFDPPYAKKQKDVKLDKRGFFYLALWLITFQVVLDKGNNVNWFQTPWVCWTSALSVAAAAMFFRSQTGRKETLVDLSVFKDRNFSAGTFIQVMVQAVLYSSIVILPQFLQGLMGYTAYLSGLTLMPRGIGSLVSMGLCGWLAAKYDGRVLTAIGLAMVGTSSLMLGSLNLQIANLNILIPNFVMGFGMGLAMTPLISLTVQTIKNEQMTNASGLNNLLKSIGAAIGTSIVATMLTRFAQMHQAMLVGNLSELNTVFVEKVQAMTGAFVQHTTPAVANYMAQSVMYKQLLQQATVMAFMDAFKIYGVLCIAVIPLVFLMKPTDGSVKVDSSAVLH